MYAKFKVETKRPFRTTKYFSNRNECSNGIHNLIDLLYNSQDPLTYIKTTGNMRNMTCVTDCNTCHK